MRGHSGTYLGVVSDHNVAELFGAVAHRPEYIRLLVTKDIYLSAALSLQAMLQDQLPTSNVDIIGCTSKVTLWPGDTWDGAMRWRDYVHDQLVTLPKPHILNITGGTKVLIMALIADAQWSALDYRPMPSDHTEHIDGNKQHSRLIPDSDDISVLDVLSLYMAPGTPRKVGATLWGYETAAQMFEGINHHDPALAAVREFLRNGWYGNPPDTPALQASPFTAHSEEHPALFTEEARAWWGKLADIATTDPVGRSNKPPFVINDAQVTVSATLRSKAGLRRWQRWVAGEWLEHLAYHWVSQRLHNNKVAMAVQQQSNENTDSQREVDVVTLHRGQLSVVECKAALDHGDPIRQLTSLTDNQFGKANKVLLVPVAAITDQDALMSRCKANGIKLCTCEEELHDAI